jgi:trehalose/maltose hydrolase-like predicted phosphorylase
MAGTLQIVIDNFAGLELRPGEMLLMPSMPCGWESAAFCFLYRGSRYDVSVTNDKVQVAAGPEGEGEMVVRVDGSKETLEPGGTVTVGYAKEER